MKSYSFESRDVPVLVRTEVLVVGSGPAGISAAVASARTGAKTLIVERYGCLGGALTVSNVSSYSFSVNKFPETLSGIPKEIDERCRAYGAYAPYYRGSGIFVEAEAYKCMLDEWMAEEGINILLHTTVIGAVVEEGVIRGVFCHSKSGIGVILADSVVDASGDGDVSAYAGAPFEKRDREKLQPVSVVFGISDVDSEKFNSHFEKCSNVFSDVFTKAAEAGEWNSPKRGGAWKILTPSGDIKSLNLTLVREIDATDVFDLTRAEIEGRRQINHIIYLFRKYGKHIGLGECTLRAIAPQLGLRETRRIVGEYQITGSDVREMRSFEDGIGRLVCTIDLYGDLKTSYKPEQSETFSVPYRALVPKGVDGLLVAGRCISCDEVSFGAVRLMVGCALTGQAAGVAAALSVRQGVKPRELDVNDVRAALVRFGTLL
jgi:ribulose 1,5-bisphosphate synthetase/thiazole synthase